VSTPGLGPTLPPPSGTTAPAAPRGVRHTRISGTWTAVAVIAIMGVALIAFLVQNTRSVQIQFFGADGHIPVAIALLAAALIGALLVLGVGIARTTQLRIAARRQSTSTSFEPPPVADSSGAIPTDTPGSGPTSGPKSVPEPDTHGGRDSSRATTRPT
jgi:uncharacterized integral membrane protein